MSTLNLNGPTHQTSSGDFAVGKVLSTAFSIPSANLGVFGALAAVVFVPLALINWLIGEGVLASLTEAVVTQVLAGAVAYAVFQHLGGKRPGFDQVVSVGVRYAGWLFLLGIVSSLGIGLGFLLLVIPGVMLACGWAVAPPVLVVEEKGVLDALTRSWELSEGYRWKIFVIQLAFFVIALGIGLGAGVIIALIDSTLTGLFSILMLNALTAVLSMFQATVTAVIYGELIRIKEGRTASDLASVFE